MNAQVAIKSMNRYSTGGTSSNSNLITTAGLAACLGFVVAGSVHTTTAIPDTYIAPKSKAALLLFASSTGLKVVSESFPAIDPPQWVADLGWIKAQSDVTVSRLAELFGVTRKAFYGWTEGANPKKGGSHARISTLRGILGSFTSPLHRTAFFNVLDEPVGEDRLSFQAAFQRSVDEPTYRDFLNGKLEELAPVLEAAVQRLGRPTAASRAFEIDYPSI